MVNSTPAGHNRAPDDIDPPEGAHLPPLGREDIHPPGDGGQLQQWPRGQQWQPPASASPAPRSYYDNGPGLYGQYSVHPAKRATNVAAVIIIVVAISFMLFTIVAIFTALFIVM